MSENVNNVKVNSANSVNSFEILNRINVSDKIKEKIGLKYLSWADAWGYLKANYPDAFYTIYDRKVNTTETYEVKDEMGGTRTIITETTNDIPYFTDGKTCFVKVGVTIDDVEYVENLPVMDNRNNAVPIAAITMTVVNKAIQRAFVKACARHGLGLYVYAGEDLPDIDKKPNVFIDYNAIESKVSAKIFNDISDEQAAQLKNQIQNDLQGFGGVVSSNVSNYISKIIGEYKIARISENNEALQKVSMYINEIKSLLN